VDHSGCKPESRSRQRRQQQPRKRRKRRRRKRERSAKTRRQKRTTVQSERRMTMRNCWKKRKKTKMSWAEGVKNASGPTTVWEQVIWPTKHPLQQGSEETKQAPLSPCLTEPLNFFPVCQCTSRIIRFVVACFCCWLLWFGSFVVNHVVMSCKSSFDILSCDSNGSFDGEKKKCPRIKT
jgi:hypothetical protein